MSGEPEGVTIRERAATVAVELAAEADRFDGFYAEVARFAPGHLPDGFAARDLAKSMRLLAARMRAWSQKSVDA